MASAATVYVLFESPTGYALFQRRGNEEVGAADVALQHQLSSSPSTLASEWVSLVGYSPFRTPENALEDAICLSEGLLSPGLSHFLSSSLSLMESGGGADGVSSKKKKSSSSSSTTNWELAVSDPRLGSAIHEAFPSVRVVSNESVTELARLLRQHAEKLLPEHQKGDIARAQCGLGHAFSRNKVKFNVHRSDNMIIQASALLEHMDKGVNLLGMRVKEWYGWHFPELAKEVPDPTKYCKIALVLGNRGENEELQQQASSAFSGEGGSPGGGEGYAEEGTLMARIANDILEGDEALAARVIEKAANSMGGELAELDYETIHTFATRVDALATYRLSLQQYLVDKMMLVAPNLTSLIGQSLGARLISKSGSLTNLAKSPASTIQILGAEKALFRALKKKKGNTPKYGLLFHSSFIQRAAKENRGRVSRYVANKAAIASRIDCFLDQPPTVFGDALKEQVEARLSFLEAGGAAAATKGADNSAISNKAVMETALQQYAKVLRKREKRQAREAAAKEEEEAAAVEEVPKKKKRRTEELAE